MLTCCRAACGAWSGCFLRGIIQTCLQQLFLDVYTLVVCIFCCDVCVFGFSVRKVGGHLTNIVMFVILIAVSGDSRF